MTNLTQLIKEQKEPFQKLDRANGNLLAWEQECLFARQQVTRQQKTIEAVQNNPDSLKNALLNVAAVGISLNPALAHAYLVPRDGKICLDISYKGLVWMATDSHAIKYCKSVLVYESDTFKWKGPYNLPEHDADVFSTDRGQAVGAYNIAYLNDGQVMIETMSRADLDKIKKSSKAQNGPWKTWEDQMQLKSVTKRAFKSWPQTESLKRVNKAVEVLDEHEGLAYSIEEQEEFARVVEKGDVLEYLNFTAGLGQVKFEALLETFEYGTKTELKQKCFDLRSKGHELLSEWSSTLKEAIDNDDTNGALEIYNDFTPSVQDTMMARLSSEQADKLLIMQEEQAA